VQASRLGEFASESTRNEESLSTTGKFGAKLVLLIDILKNAILAKREKALIFIQFEDLMGKVGEALVESGIKYLVIRGTVLAKKINIRFFFQAFIIYMFILVDSEVTGFTGFSDWVWIG
jgi:hypothetical protein